MRWTKRAFSLGARLSKTAWAGYIVAVAGTLAAAWLRSKLAGLFGPETPFYATFYPVIILSAFLGGIGAGFLATFLAALLVIVLFVQPVGSARIERSVDMASIVIFITVNLMMSAACGALRKARRRSKLQAAELARTVDLLDLTNVMVRDSRDRIIRWNTGCQQLYGFAREEALGRISHELLRTEFPEPLERIQSKLEATGRWQGELKHTSKAGRRIIIAGEWLLRREVAGQPTVIIEVCADVTERKQAEQQLRLQSAALQAAANSIIITDAKGAIQWVNPAFEQLTGYRADEAVGRTTRLLKSGRHPAAFYQLMWKTVLAGQVWRGELVNRRKDGSEYTEQMTITPVLDADSRIAHFVAIKQDVTEIARASEVLARSRQELERLVQERTARLRETMSELEHMSYSMVHDMRAPLRAMQSFATLLQEECARDLSPQGLDYFRRIRESADRMDRLVTDALNYSRLVREELPIAPVEVGKLLRSLLETYPDLQSTAADICIEFTQRIVLGNESLLTQCFSNLLSNAVKFVSPGCRARVRVWAESAGAERQSGRASERGPIASESTLHAPDAPHVRFWIEDNGIGIPKEAQQKIFGMFQRLHRDQEYPGTGIGLAIVWKAVERMNGKAGVESEPGKGSRFWIELPIAADTQSGGCNLSVSYGKTTD